MKADILVVIPARGGSVGVPRKNLRALAGKPLISYSIQTAKSSTYNPDVCVSSDDDEILHLAAQLGAMALRRPKFLADGKTTLDPVIYHAYQQAQLISKKDYALIVTMQPTSPLMAVSSIDDALNIMLKNAEVDTLISAKETTHLTWRYEEGRYLPNYAKRLNRQELTPTYTETGGFLITRNSIITENNRIGSNVSLYPLEKGEAIDIDSFEDFALAEFWSTRKKLLFVVSGNQHIGLSHARRALLLANQFTCCDIRFLVTEDSEEALSLIKENKYVADCVSVSDILENIFNFNPDVVINNIRNTDVCYVRSIQEHGIKVVNMEDEGPGHHFADLSINALSTVPSREKEYNGISYYCLGDKYLHAQPWKGVKEAVKSILICFGGKDEDNLTARVARLIAPWCMENGIKLHILPGIGYTEKARLNEIVGVDVYETADLPKQMLDADLVITSPGRTAIEVASLSIPAIILRHGLHDANPDFYTMENGFADLGNASIMKDEDILNAIKNITLEYRSRIFMHHMMATLNIKPGIRKVTKLINNILQTV